MRSLITKTYLHDECVIAKTNVSTDNFLRLLKEIQRLRLFKSCLANFGELAYFGALTIDWNNAAKWNINSLLQMRINRKSC